MESSTHQGKAKSLPSMIKVIHAEFGDLDRWKNYLKGLMEGPWSYCEDYVKGDQVKLLRLPIQHIYPLEVRTDLHWTCQSESEPTSQTQPAPAQGHSTNPKVVTLLTQRLHTILYLWWVSLLTQDLIYKITIIRTYILKGLCVDVQDVWQQGTPSQFRRYFSRMRERLTFDEELVGHNSAQQGEDVVDIVNSLTVTLN